MINVKLFKLKNNSIFMNQFIFIFLLSLITINFVSANVETLGTFQQDICIDFKQSYSNATYTNFSDITYPNGTTFIFSPELSGIKSGITYYYNTCDYTDALGEYQLCGHTDVDGVDTNWCYNYYITESGERFDESQATMLLGIFGMMALLFGIGSQVDKRKWKVKSLFNMFALLMALLLLNSIRVVIGTSSTLASMGSLGLVIGIVILSFMFFYMLVTYTIEVFYYFKDKRNSKWEISNNGM